MFRHEPVAGNDLALRAAVLAEYADQTAAKFWPVHVALMRCNGVPGPEDLDRIAAEAGLPAGRARCGGARRGPAQGARRQRQRARAAAPGVAPTFFINDRRYDGPWDEGSLSDALLGSLGHRLQAATVDFVRWGPSAGVALLLMSVLAVVLANSSIGARFAAFWQTSFGLQLGGRRIRHAADRLDQRGTVDLLFSGRRAGDQARVHRGPPRDVARRGAADRRVVRRHGRCRR